MWLVIKDLYADVSAFSAVVRSQDLLKSPRGQDREEYCSLLCTKSTLIVIAY